VTGGGEPVWYCRTCSRALNTGTTARGQLTYRHATELRGEASDHPADPVPLTQLPHPVMECDFCSRPNPVWVYVCDDQHTEVRVVTARVVGAADYQRRHHAARTLGTQTAPGITQAWGQRWSACDGCAALIESRDLYGLIARVTDAMPAKYTRGKRLVRVRGGLHATYSGLLATLAPGRGRITPEHPLGVWQAPPHGAA
jgi:hypothetical protein